MIWLGAGARSGDGALALSCPDLSPALGHGFPTVAGTIRRRTDPAMIRVVIPPHLRILAQVGAEIQLEVAGPVTQRSVLDALEARYPMLRGTIRDHGTLKRRPMLRYFACEDDLSHDPPDTPLPEAVASGKEPFWIIAAIAGG